MRHYITDGQLDLQIARKQQEIARINAQLDELIKERVRRQREREKEKKRK